MTRQRKRLALILLLVVVVGAGTAVALSNRPERTLVQVGRVERVALLESVVTATGEIRAKDFVDLQTEIAGVIVELPVREGDRVQAGDVLLRIDPFQAQQDLASAQAQYDAACADQGSALIQVSMGEASAARDEFTVKAAESDLVRAQSSRDLLLSQLARRKELAGQSLISAEEYEATESALRVAESDVGAAAARLNQARSVSDLTRVTIEQWRKQHEAAERRCGVARANLERMEDLLGKTTITSPLGGVITKLNVSKGERAVPGILSNPEATLMTIADLSTIEAEMKVDETDIIMVSIDDEATVTVDALPESELHGRVTELGNSPIGATSREMSSPSGASQEGKDFKVVVRIESPPATLRPGLTAGADIFVESREQALVVPLQAVTVREVRVDAEGRYVPPDDAELQRLERGGSAPGPAATDAEEAPMEELEGVFVRDGERVRFRPVTLGIKGESDVEVVEGLAEGEEIVIGSYKVLRVLKEWDLVEVDEEAAKTPRRPKRRTRR